MYKSRYAGPVENREFLLGTG